MPCRFSICKENNNLICILSCCLNHTLGFYQSILVIRSPICILVGIGDYYIIQFHAGNPGRSFNIGSLAYSADLFTAGFRAALVGDSTLFTDDKAREYFEDRLVASREEAQRVYREANEQWLAQNRDKEGVKTTASGLQYKILRAGTGAVPTDKDRVTVKYEGKMIDGTVFDSSYKRTPQTSTFGCTQVIKGWTEALTMMPVGSKWELYIPQELGYGSRQAGQIKPYSTLIFTVELEGIEQAAPKN